MRPNGLPDIAWCEVSMGNFIFHDGTKINLSTYYLARYPITYAQYKAFLDSPDGYRNERWWEEPTRLAERQSAPGKQAWPMANHPANNVSWYDAMAFCRWLTARMRATGALEARWVIRLPTEQEWEKAARGKDGREWPWGSAWEDRRANTSESGIDQPTAVGMYPDGASPYGVLDMAGNVWEWCLNAYDTPTDIDAAGDPRRDMLGGSFYNLHGLAHAAYRNYDRPDARYSNAGFRCCRGSPISG